MPETFLRMQASIVPSLLSRDTECGIGSSPHPNPLCSRNTQPTISRLVSSIPSLRHFTRKPVQLYTLDFSPKVETLDKAMMVMIRSSDFLLECAPAVSHRWADCAAGLAPASPRNRR